jgi:hypothetical protein
MGFLNYFIRKLFKYYKKNLIGQTNIHLIKNNLLMGKILSDLNSKKQIKKITELEFSIFSQWGDDGIIQYLISKVDITNKIFVEFGVENYTESNTRFLLINNNWTGLVIDGSKKNIDYIINDEIFWKYDLIAKCSFITSENINQIIKDSGIEGEIGLLHIDIDGNDYWVWKSLNIISPDIVIVEYNSILGYNRPLTIPYNPNFVRTNENHSSLYAGSSLLSLCDLAEAKGYYFIGSNSAGNNAYFVKKNKINGLTPLKPSFGYVESKFREAKDKNNNLIYTRSGDRIKHLKLLPFINTRTNQIEYL